MSLCIEQDDLSHDYLLRRLAVESASFSDVLVLLRQIVPKSVDLIKSYIPNLLELQNPSTPIQGVSNKLYKDVLVSAGKVSFLAYDKTGVSVPEGFSGELIPYLQLLISHTEEEIKEGAKVLSDYNLQLSMFISNADIRTSMKSHSEFYKDVRSERDRRQKEIAKFFDKKNGTLSRRPLGNLIERFNDLDKVFTLSENLGRLRGQLSYKTVVADVQKTVDMLGLVKARLEDSTISDVSGQMAKNLSEGAYEIAKFVEAMSLNGYLVDTALGMTHNLAEQLKALLAKS